MHHLLWKNAKKKNLLLLQLIKKKRTEIDFINVVIVRQAQGLGISVPVNAMLVDLIKAIEASYDSGEV